MSPVSRDTAFSAHTPYAYCPIAAYSCDACAIGRPGQSKHRKIGHEAIMSSIIPCKCASSIHIPNVDGFIYASSTASRGDALPIRGPCDIKDVCQQAGMALIDRECLSCS